MPALKPWYRVVTPREDLREGKPLDASEFAVHLDQVRDGRTEVLKSFLVEEGAGRDTRFWRLAQALSALYPSGSEEKRRVDGVPGRKKGPGF